MLSGSKAVPMFFGDILGVSGGEKENIFYLIPSIPFILPDPATQLWKELCANNAHPALPTRNQSSCDCQASPATSVQE